MGYAYLGRWSRFVPCLVTTLGLIIVAFLSDGASRPWIWRAIAAAWIAWMVWDGVRQGRCLAPASTALTARRRLALGVVAGLLVVGMAAGYAAYVAASRRVFAVALAAHERGVCQEAIAGYKKVTTFYELTLSSNVTTAEAKTRQCEAFLSAEQSQERALFAEAIDQYHDYQRMYPNTALVPFVEEKLPATYFAWGASLRETGSYADAIVVYTRLLEENNNPEIEDQARDSLAQTYFEQADLLRSQVVVDTRDQLVGSTSDVIDSYLFILRELPDTPAAADVPQAIIDTYNQALASFNEGRYCEAVPILDYFASLSGSETAHVVAMAHGPRAQAIFECGMEEYLSSNFNGAIGEFKKLLTAYPDNALVPQAQYALIMARIAKVKGQGTGQLPPPLDSNSSGSVTVMLYNESPLPVTILVGGPTAHEIVLEACFNCPRLIASSSDACTDFTDKPSATLQLVPGQYDIVAQFLDDPTITPFFASRSVEADFVYTECFYVGRESSGSVQPTPPT